MLARDAVAEIVVSKARAGVSRDQLAELGRRIQAWAKEQPGFLERKLVEASDSGTWIDMVAWRTEADAKRAAAAMGSAPCMTDVQALLDETSISIFHGAAIPLDASH